MNYIELAEVYERLESTTKRLEKTYIISEFLKKIPDADLPQTTLLLEGRLYPAWDEREVGVASQLLLKAICVATGSDITAVEKCLKTTGDLGKVAEELSKKKKQVTLFSQQLTVKKVFDNLRKLSETTGPGSVDRKVQLIAELLTSSKPIEARYIIRTTLGDLRVGVGSGSMRDAIVWAYFPKIVGIFFKCTECKKWVPNSKKCVECGKAIDNNPAKEIKRFNEKEFYEAKDTSDLVSLQKHKLVFAKDDKLARELYNAVVAKVQQAYDLTNDFSVVAEKAKANGIKGLDTVELKMGVPVKVMLAIKAKTIEEGFERTGKPAAAEYKYDGFRMQVHKKGEKIWIYTRRLEEVTDQFPDVVENIKKSVKGDNLILDSEAVGFNPKTKAYMPFQKISQRIKRKYGIDQMAKELPVELNVFDIIAYQGKNLINEPFIKRREIIEKIIKPSERKIVLSKSIITDKEADVKKFFAESKAKGNEGIMMKTLDAPYKPGARVGHMVKYKETMETLDLVIVGAEWGHGKRAKWLSSFTIACKKGDEFVEVGQVGTGIKEKEEEGISFAQLTELLKPLITSEKGSVVTVKPKIIIEVGYEEIQKSPTYSSGYALRFPRVLRLRDDKGKDDCSTINMVEDLYKSQ